MLAAKLGEIVGQSVIVENRPVLDRADVR